MCSPANAAVQRMAGETLRLALYKIGAVSTAASTIGGYYANKKNYEYRTQNAIINAQNAKNEALKEKQLGIEKSRLEKIEGLKEVNKLKAINAASGLDSMSETSKLSYEDTLNASKAGADVIQKEYDKSALSYFNQANSYLNEAKSYQKEYRQSLFDYSLNALGKVHSVADDWFKEVS